MSKFAIGIDLGTTNSCVSLYQTRNSLEILENSEGKRLTASCVFYPKKPSELPIVGSYAKLLADSQPSNGIYEIKRFIGKNFDSIKDSLNYFSYNVINESNKPVIVIEQQNQTKNVTPQDIYVLILKKLKKDIETKLGQPISNVVITVPTYFNSSQREITLSAAAQAGFKVLKLLNEPSAAALSFFFRNPKRVFGYTLVYDFGGGTFDVSLLKRTEGCIDTINVDGDINLGGKDLDNLLIDYVCENLLKNYNFYLKQNRRLIRRLQNKCEEAKIHLSTANETTIILDGFIKNHSVVSIEIKRSDFESKAEKIFQKTIFIVERCITRANLSKTKIKDVILAGGSSRIPKIQQMLTEFFDNRTVSRFVNLDECVAEGAALQAAMLIGIPNQKFKKLHMTDIVPLSIGIKDWVGRMIFIIKKGSRIPISADQTFSNSHDMQTHIALNIYEGECLDIRKNRFLGTLSMKITPSARKECKINCRITIDSNGILKITADEEFGNNRQEIDITYCRGIRSDNEICETLENAEFYQHQDERFKKFAELKETALLYVDSIKKNLSKSHLNRSREFKDVYIICKEIKDDIHLLNVEDEIKLHSMIEHIKSILTPVAIANNFTALPNLNV